jgi:Zn-dependent protease
MGLNLQAAILRFVALLPALTFHEFAHAYSAWKCGDPTPQMHGRVTLNPLAHLDPIGTLMILFAPFGWAKPVPINPANFRYPSRDIIITSAVGPLSNLVQGIFWGLVLRAVYTLSPGLLTGGSLVGQLLLMMMVINFMLAAFNLIPVGPLDGHHIVEYALPYDAAVRYRRFNAQYGTVAMIVFVLLLFATPVGDLFFGAVLLVASLVSGVNLG